MITIEDISIAIRFNNPCGLLYEKEFYWLPKPDFYLGHAGLFIGIKWLIFEFRFDVETSTQESRDRLSEMIKKHSQ